MNRSIYISLLLMILIVGCASKPGIVASNEEAVYESLFVEITDNTHKDYYLVETTESHWFKSNPYEEDYWSELNDIHGLSTELAKSLYEVNLESKKLRWAPSLTNAIYLPSFYNSPASAQDNQDRCIVEEGLGNISIRANGKSYRSYYSVSKVAFSRSGKHALVKYSYHCAPLSGAGEFFVLFHLVDDAWTITGFKALWIS